MKILATLNLGLLLLAAGRLPVAAQTNGHWDGRFWIAGFSMPQGLAPDADGGLLMTGTLPVLAGPPSRSLAHWDGRRWTGLTNSRPRAIAAGDGSTWLVGSPRTNLVSRLRQGAEPLVLPGVTGRLDAAAVGPVGLLVGGSFEAGAATNVALWDGAAWQPLGPGLPRPVNRLLAADGKVFAALAGVDAEPAAVWRWDGAAWAVLAPLPGTGAAVNDLLWHEGRLHAALNAADTNAAVVAWSGDAWEAVGQPPLTGLARAAVAYQGRLYVAGSLGVEGAAEAGLARLEGGRWVALATSPGELMTEGSALAVVADQLFALARVPRVLGLTAGSTIALWQHDGADWWLHGGGLEFVGAVRAMTEDTQGLVLAGNSSGPASAGRFGYLWDGRAPRQLGLVLPQPGVNILLGMQLAASESRVYQTASRSTGGLLLRLEGTNWIIASTTMPYSPGALAAGAGGALYVVGSGSAAGSGTNVVVRWQAEAWTTLGGGFKGGPVAALAEAGGRLFAGGQFTNVAGQPAGHLAAWSGAAWEALMPAPDARVTALAAWGDGLLVGGAFTNVGGLTSPAVARWTPQGWEPFGEGLGLATVTAVAVSADGTVAVAGTRALRVEFWLRRDGAWQRIGLGSGGLLEVNALLWRGRDLFAGGGFIDIDDIQSDTFAIWHEPRTALELLRRGGDLGLRRTGALPGASVIEMGPEVTAYQPWRTNSAMNMRDIFPVNPPAAGAGFYRERTVE